MQAKVGHYEIVSELGRGGMGVVYKGHEPALGRYVAIKQLAPSLAHDESIKQRFLREARSMAALNDPHIVQIYLIGEEDGQPFFAMEFVEGESLSALLKREGRMSAPHAARVVFQTAQGLATAHAKGVIHRDIKPGNLLLTTRGMLKIADFGIALSASDTLASKLTATGGFVGTPGYLSPEVCMGKPVDARADIFALGIVLFELLTGRMPFRDESPLGLMLEVVQTEIPDIRELNGEVDEALAGILAKMTAKNPDDRFATADELAAALAEHPMVTRNAAVTARIIMSPAAATMVAPMTPIPQSLLTPAPNFGVPAADVATRALTPGGVAMPLPSAGVAGQDIATHQRSLEPMARPSALARPDRGSGNNNGLWLVAAALVLLLAGGAWAMRAQWMPGAAGESASATTASNAAAAAAGIAAVVATATPSDATARQPTEAERAARAATVAGVIAEADAVSGEGSAANAGAANGTNAATQAAGLGVAGALAASDANASANGLAQAEPAALAASDGARNAANADPGGSAVGPRAGRRAALAAAVADRREVRAEERREPVAVRNVPRRIAIITIGDTAVTGPARQMLEEALSDGGFDLFDTDMAGVGDLSVGQIPGAVGHLAQRNGVGAAVVIRAEPAGSQQLNYYGRSSQMNTAQLSVKLYDAASRSPIGAGFRAPVNYTGPTADYNTREALQPNVSQVLSNLARYRDADRG